MPWRSLVVAVLGSLLWLAPIVRGVIFAALGRFSVVALAAGVTMVLAPAWGRAIPLWAAAAILTLVAALLLARPANMGVMVEPGGMVQAVVTAMVMTAVQILAAYGAAREMQLLSWPLAAKVAVATLVSFASSAAAVCIGVIGHILMGGEWL